MEGHRHFLEVLPFSDDYGLDWLIVVVVPESDFMAQIYSNTRTTIVAIGIALATALVVGVFSTRLITHPILTLNEAVKDIAQGQWRRLDHYDRADELGELAKAVDSMALQLQSSFETLEAQKNRLCAIFPAPITSPNFSAKPA